MNIWSGSGWLLVGPQYSAGSKTGPVVETIVDAATPPVEHTVVCFYAENNLISIISKAAFTPKQTIAGFPTIGQGVNLSTVDATSTTAPTKFHGTASRADALVVDNKTISSSEFLRSDVVSTSNFGLNVRNAAGISVGSDLNFNIGTEDSGPVIFSRTSGKSIDIKVNNNSDILTAVHITATGHVGIGPNNTDPAEVLDVAGSIQLDGSIIVIGDVDSTQRGTGSIRTNGGLAVTKRSNFGGDASFYGQQLLHNLDVNGDPVDGSVILPGTDSAHGKYDIGSSTRSFRNIYANAFVGAFSGSVRGNVTGDLDGSATSLANTTYFSLSGNVETVGSAVPFNGSGGDIVLNTILNSSAITSQTAVTRSESSDKLLVFREASGTVAAGLRSITKANFISDLPVVPVGAVFPFAGTVIPPGYLLCDGSEVKVTTYSALFNVIGYRYKNTSDLKGAATFGLPDFRGSFPLGKQDMNNNLEVPSKTDLNTLIPAITPKAARVTDSVAKTLGAQGGQEYISVTLTNLPDHKHDLISESGAQYYAAGIPGAPADAEARSGYGMPNTSIGYGLPNSGGVDAQTVSNKLGQPISTMNPFMTINYIIFTGVIL
jgi:microcystin-dependent protein